MARFVQTSKVLLSSSLHRNTVYLLAQSLCGSLTGFVFWTLSTRYYSPYGVGIGSALVSTMMLVGFVGSLGLGIGVIRFLPVVSDRNGFLNSSYAACLVSASLMALIFVIGLPLWSPGLAFLRGNLALASLFIVIVAVNCLSNVIQQTFIGLSQSRFTVYHNLIFVIRLLFLAILPALEGFGIVLAWGAGELVATLVDLFVFLPKSLQGYHFRPHFERAFLRGIGGFTSANYIGELLKWLPGWILPVMVVNALGPESNAFFYVSWTISGAVLAIPMITSMSLFAEGSQSQADVSKHLKSSLLFSIFLLVPAVVVVCVFADKFLLLMGREYSAAGVKLIWLLAPATISVCVTQSYVSLARVEMKSSKVVILMGTLAASVLGLGWFLMHRLGILGIGVAWLASQTVAMLVVLPSVIRKSRQAHLR